jgi:Ca-activated chloride channel family protein
VKAGLIFLMVGGVWISSFHAVGQTGKQEPAVRAATDASGAPVRTVDLNVLVLDHEKQPVAGLDGTAFQISEDDGVSKAVQAVTGAGGPVSLCLAVDESGSTKTMRQPIIDAVVALVKGLPAGSEVMVVHFADQAFLDIPFTPVQSVDPAKLRQMNSHGGTALYDALVAAEKFMLAYAHEKRRALVIISDGGDNASKLKLEQAARRLPWPGAPMLYAMAFSDGGDSPAQSWHNERTMKELMKSGGGVTLIAKNAKEMASKAEEISVMIDSQIVLSFASLDSANPERFHKLDVLRPGAAKGEVVHAMPGLFLHGASADRGTK